MSGQRRFITPTPIWPRAVRFLYRLILVAIALAGAYYIIVYAHGIRESGSLLRGGEHVVPQYEDGETIYITTKQQADLNLYGAGLAISLLTWLFLGIVLEMKLKIRIFNPLPPKPAASEPKMKHGPPPTFSPN